MCELLKFHRTIVKDSQFSIRITVICERNNWYKIVTKPQNFIRTTIGYHVTFGQHLFPMQLWWCCNVWTAQRMQKDVPISNIYTAAIIRKTNLQFTWKVICERSFLLYMSCSQFQGRRKQIESGAAIGCVVGDGQAVVVLCEARGISSTFFELPIKKLLSYCSISLSLYSVNMQASGWVQLA